MKYKNAKKVLPPALMDEVQKYVQGEYLYIPKAEGTRKRWGDNSGYRRSLSLRNDAIRREFHEGVSIENLSQTYFLAESTIKKIIYAGKEQDFEDKSEE